MNVIKDLRKKAKLNQTELAKIVGVSQSTLSYWERGDFEPDHDGLIALADYFKVSTDYLLGRDINNIHRINMLREKQGLTIDELAQASGVAAGVILQWESGYAMAETKDIDKLADYFGVTLEYLIGFSDTPQTEKSAPEGTLDLSDIEFAFLRDVRELDEQDRAVLADYAAKMRELADLKKKVKNTGDQK